MITDYWWLSFVDETAPEGQGFLGVAIIKVDAPDSETLQFAAHVIAEMAGIGRVERTDRDASMVCAVARAHRLGINPGGQVAGILMSADNPDAMAEVQLWGVDRLITPAELKAAGYHSESEL